METKQDSFNSMMRIADSPALRRPSVNAAEAASDGHGGVACQEPSGAPPLGHPCPSPAAAVVVCTDRGDPFLILPMS